MYTEAVEDYLKAIFYIAADQGKVTTTALADHLGLAPASVTSMIKKLAMMKLVTYAPYRGVTLTDAGRQTALAVVRHHRLIELYLATALGIPWDRVHAEAEKWEHVVSEEVEERIDQLLGHPTADPHGAPIPARDGTLAQVPRVRLDELEKGQSAVLLEVSDADPSLLRYAASLGLYPGVTIDVVAKHPFEGPIDIRVGSAEHTISLRAAQCMLAGEIKATSAEGAR